MVSLTCPESPFHLSHVCRYWRVVANSENALWSSIVIMKPSRHHAYRTALWMARVGTHPLDVTVVQSDNPDVEEEDATNQLVRILAERIRTWRSLQFHFNGRRFPYYLLDHLNVLKSGWPDVQLGSATISLDIHHQSLPRNVIDETSPVFPIQATWSLINSLDSVRILSWNASYTPGPSFSRNLRILDLHSCISVEEFLERIPHCQRLEELYIHRLSKPNSITFLPEHLAIEVYPTPRMPIAFLRRLSINAQMDIGPILQAVSMPNLRILDLICHQPVNFRYIRDFLSESGCVLEVFNFWSQAQQAQTDAGAVEQWLKVRELKHLRAITLINVEINNRILQLLHRPGEGGQTLFPKLEQLTLAICNHDVDEELLLRMLGSRYWTPPGVSSMTGHSVELRQASIMVRNLSVGLMKYAEMICKNGEVMGDRRISCTFAVP
jgi:hypothetical protein